MTNDQIKQLACNYAEKYIVRNSDYIQVKRSRLNKDGSISITFGVAFAPDKIIRLMAGDWHDAGTYQRI